MSKKSIKPVVAAVGALFAASVTTTAMADTNPFGMQALDSGYMQVAGSHEGGKCGVGKCGGEKKTEEAKCGAGKCGGEKKTEEAKCGAGKCGGEKKTEEAKCGAGKCGGEKKSEGKCGAGKCGGSK